MNSLPPAPPLALASGLLLWGWQCGFLLHAVAMAALLEAARLIGWRLALTDREFNNVSDLSSIVFLLVALYAFAEKSVHGIFTILSWLPFIFFPLILAQLYSTRGKIKLSALFISLRRIGDSGAPWSVRDLDLSLPYLFLCMISASAGNQRTIVFFIVVFLLVAWTLWTVRPNRYRLPVWLLLIVFSFGLAQAGQAGLQRLQAAVESTVLGWFDQFIWRSRDPDRATTAIGSLGKLKLSDRIVVRVDAAEKLGLPLLLREASYSSYNYGVWTNLDSAFTVIDPALDGTQWVLNPPRDAGDAITVSVYLDEVRAIVPVPHGTTEITNTGATQIETSQYGAVRLEMHAGWIQYDARYDQHKSFDALPGREDLEISQSYRDELSSLAGDLRLAELAPEERITAVEKFFAENFEYSLAQNQRYPRGRYLSKFLFTDRKGHCEYFATATALLLRAAGIPTRYAVGYAVQEYSWLEGRYIARTSHLHSWALAYVNNAWVVVDTTPPLWAPLEDSDRSRLQPLLDLWSWLAFLTTGRDLGKVVSRPADLLLWLFVPLAGYLGWSVWSRARARQNEAGRAAGYAAIRRPGMDSSFYRLVAQLEKQYLPRRPGESLMAWLDRVTGPADRGELQPLLAMHYRYRFDPAGLDGEAKKAMDAEVDKALLTPAGPVNATGQSPHQ